MKLTVFGATGRTGLQVVEQGLAAGHHVRAVVRDATRLVPDRAGLDVVVADVMDPATIVEAVAGSDAVVSTIGTRNGRKPTTVCADTSRSIVEAMHKAGTRRLVVVSGTGPFDEGEGPGMRYVIKPLGRRFLRHASRTSWRWKRSCGPADWIGQSCDPRASPTSRSRVITAFGAT